MLLVGRHLAFLSFQMKDKEEQQAILRSVERKDFFCRLMFAHLNSHY
jgi:hypothetical protein